MELFHPLRSLKKAYRLGKDYGEMDWSPIRIKSSERDSFVKNFLEDEKRKELFNSLERAVYNLGYYL